ncbi:MAG: hypothetical protein IJ621_03510 [Paludibacteraceae bacterium]|nr:hypothetical protein [Paludibacteraceae bacterium]
MKNIFVYLIIGGVIAGMQTGCKSNKSVTASAEPLQQEQAVATIDAVTGATEPSETTSYDNVPRPNRVPAYRGLIARVQPDGDTLHIFLRGDEWSHFSMTMDGYEVQEDSVGKICYMQRLMGETMAENGQEKVVTDRQAHDPDKRTEKERKWLERNGVWRMVKEYK